MYGEGSKKFGLCRCGRNKCLSEIDERGLSVEVVLEGKIFELGGVFVWPYLKCNNSKDRALIKMRKKMPIRLSANACPNLCLFRRNFFWQKQWVPPDISLIWKWWEGERVVKGMWETSELTCSWLCSTEKKEECRKIQHCSFILLLAFSVKCCMFTFYCEYSDIFWFLQVKLYLLFVTWKCNFTKIYHRNVSRPRV